MCVHSETNNPILEHPEKLNWSENGVQELLCESNFVDMNNQIHVDTKDLNVIHLNVRGINSKVTDLKYLIEHSLYGSPVDIIALCETWLTKYLPIPNIPGYKFIQKCRENKHDGGVALLISNHINYKILPEIQYNDASIESCFIKIKLNARQILVGSCYRPPNTDPKLFMKLHRNLFSTSLKRNKLMILCMYESQTRSPKVPLPQEQSRFHGSKPLVKTLSYNNSPNENNESHCYPNRQYLCKIRYL